VPRVFVDGVFIGGGSDVRKMSQSGKLQELLQK
jgi:glutaredoxin 3